MKKYSLLAVAVATASLAATSAQASGFRLHETSTSGMGTAHAGRGALVEDASIVYYNPAGMSKLKQAEFSAGFSYIDIHGSFNNAHRTTVTGGSAADEGNVEGGDMFPASVIPFAYYARPLSEKVAIGFGVFVPFGTNSEYDENSIAGGFARETKVTSIELQPSVSYKISDTFSVGAGLDIVYIKGILSKDLDLIPSTVSSVYNGYENTWEVEGDDVNVGFNLGFMWDVTPKTTLGLTYRSAIEFTLEGESRFVKGGNVSFYNTQTQAISNIGDASLHNQSSEVPLEGPQSASLSLAHTATDKLNLLATVTWVDWSSFEKLDVNGTESGIFSSLTNLGGTKIGHIDESWRDTYSFSLGASYTLNDQWLLRAGYMFDQTAVTDEYRTARVPDNNRNWFNIGARYTVNSQLSFDVAAAYMYMEKSSLNEFNKDLDNKIIPIADGVPVHQNLKGEFDLNAFALSLQMNYRM